MANIAFKSGQLTEKEHLQQDTLSEHIETVVLLPPVEREGQTKGQQEPYDLPYRVHVTRFVWDNLHGFEKTARKLFFEADVVILDIEPYAVED